MNTMVSFGTEPQMEGGKDFGWVTPGLSCTFTKLPPSTVFKAKSLSTFSGDVKDCLKKCYEQSDCIAVYAYSGTCFPVAASGDGIVQAPTGDNGHVYRLDRNVTNTSCPTVKQWLEVRNTLMKSLENLMLWASDLDLSINLNKNVRSNKAHILLRLYKSYVLPHLEYASQVWNPTRRKDIRRLERVQHTFTRLVLLRMNNRLYRRNLPPYDERLRTLRLAKHVS
ncbi:hypothetical protein OSTOST_04391 [Ostertagia ostertagi]